ncbi:hypothetical protein ACIBSW_13475 [Actinoplanes sp. NPDC049668]|uniref:hypothetical protein n=1 Tax=unclassified Actinoplanes TaxID=2626549 RepID=UPI0033B6D4B5
MRVRITFRYRVETGEVEVFQVDDVPEGPRSADHDARHEQAARGLARLIDPHARIVEELPADAEKAATPEPPAAEKADTTRQPPLREGGSR